MTKENNFLHPLYEERATLFCDGLTLHSESTRSYPDGLPLPPLYETGFCAIFHLLERMLPGLKSISSLGLWIEDEESRFVAWDLWLHTAEDDGFFLPMASAGALFSRNGIPYFHLPLP